MSLTSSHPGLHVHLGFGRTAPRKRLGTIPNIMVISRPNRVRRRGVRHWKAGDTVREQLLLLLSRERWQLLVQLVQTAICLCVIYQAYRLLLSVGNFNHLLTQFASFSAIFPFRDLRDSEN